MTTPKALLLGSITVALAAATPCWLTAPAWSAPLPAAQAGGSTLPREIVGATAPLSSDQSKVLSEFIEGFVNTIETTREGRSMDDARRALVEPLRDPSATPVFRRAFSGAAVSRLGPIIGGKDTQRAIHAMQVAAFIGTPEALALITGRLGAEEGDASRRLSAASTLGHALEVATGLSAVEFDTIDRAVFAAAEKETEPAVIQRHFRVLTIIASRSGVPEASATLARTNQVKLVRGVLSKIDAKGAADGRMVVVARAIADLQKQWTKLTSAHDKFGPIVAPLLIDVLGAGAKQWDAAHSDEGDPKSFADAVGGAEVLLRVVDTRLRAKAGEVTPANAISNAWEAKDRKAFDELVAKWTKVVSAPPYR